MKGKNNEKVTKVAKTKRYNTYSYALKRRVVNDILKGILCKEEALHKYGIRSRQSINHWIKKYGTMNYDKDKNYSKKQIPSEEIKELKARIEELESAKIILNMAIDIADEEMGTNIRKKYLAQQLKDYKGHHKYQKREK